MLRNIWLVLKHDVGVILRQRSFWLVTILLPLFFVGVQGYALLQDSEIGAAFSGGEADEGETAVAGPTTIGLVDESGLLVDAPADMPPLFVPYLDRETALADLSNNEVAQVVVIHPDYLETGQVTAYDQNFQIMQDDAISVAFGGSGWALQYLIDYNLVEDKDTLRLLSNPVPAQLATTHTLAPESDAPDGESKAMAGLIASLMPYIFYFLLIMGSSYMLRSVVAEKENRTVEVLLLSLPPRQLMLGKILAMSVVLLVQVAIWVGGGMLIVDRGASLFNLGNFTFPPGFIIWALLFLTLGYLLFAALMAAAGAVATNTREGGQMTWLLVIPLLPTLMFGSLFVEEPNSPLVVGLSLFPLSSPSAMLTRIAVAPVPLWQILLSVGLLAATTYGVISLAARFFQSGNLLSSTAFSWKRFASAWR